MEYMVQLNNIHKSFGENEILKGINMNIKKGEIVAILGPSGSGKTTLLRCINFLEKADCGSVAVDDFKVDYKTGSKKDIRKLRGKTAMVFQLYNLFRNKTILENVMEGLLVVKKMPKSEAKKISIQALENVGLGNRLNNYPIQVSGGQQQRAGIARALVLNPEVILFDEPTSALDPELVGEVLNSIKEVAKTGITMIIVTHEMAFARDVATHVVFMEDGVVVEEGPPKKIFNNPKEARTRQFLSRIMDEEEKKVVVN